jgi:hypothetical protein
MEENNESLKKHINRINVNKEPIRAKAKLK